MLGRMKFSKLSARDVVYAVDMAIACLLTYWIMASLLPRWFGWPDTPVGVLWAVISTVFVYKDSRAHSLSAGMARLTTTFVSVALCLIYLWLLPATIVGMAVLIAIGVLLMFLVGRPDEVGLTAITIAVIMIVAANDQLHPQLQPVLRLVDTVAGITVGVACKWVDSFVFYKIAGEEVR